MTRGYPHDSVGADALGAAAEVTPSMACGAREGPALQWDAAFHIALVSYLDPTFEDLPIADETAEALSAAIPRPGSADGRVSELRDPWAG